jgi:hypothetical protein
MGPAPNVSHSRARVAGFNKRPIDDPERVDAYRGLAFANLSNYMTRVLAESPPLTNEQRAALAELLRPVRRRTS